MTKSEQTQMQSLYKNKIAELQATLQTTESQLTSVSAALLSANRMVKEQEEEIDRLRELVKKQTTDWQRETKSLRGKLRSAMSVLVMITTQDEDLRDDS